MKAKTITRVLVAGVAAPMLAFGLPSAALANSFWHGDSQFAGPNGSMSQSITAAAGNGYYGGGFGGRGGGFALYKASASFAGPHGAGSQNLFSFAN
ncbi:hypothetical protein [Nocardiopsis lucentensis]|uniref:hypothetical protein n=1 Tax=Nocardiopsis lucentensis TaxID=53441 RepID=UPI000346C8A5|nr:hypothetical protein [Nocardiopsis lucentensis]